MTAYNAVLVGTDGSESSFRAVDRAAAIAGGSATLYIATAFLPAEGDTTAHDADVLGSEAYQIAGSNPTDSVLRLAEARAVAAGATKVSLRTIKGAPVEALLRLAKDVKADLLVVGNRGISSLTGRLLGSVPSDVARKADIDVLIVHTT